MSVDSFDPALLQSGVSQEICEQLLTAATKIDEPDFGLDQLSIKRIGPLARQDAADWGKLAESWSDEQVTALIRLFTLAEEQLPGWEAGAQSPVIALVRVLKDRGTYPQALTGWIKASSSNRFLPHGSLMDRL